MKRWSTLKIGGKQSYTGAQNVYSTLPKVQQNTYKSHGNQPSFPSQNPNSSDSENFSYIPPLMFQTNNEFSQGTLNDEKTQEAFLQ
jgi:hypothetical protein